MTSDPLERRLVAIMFTDIVDSAALMGASEEVGIRVRKRHFALVRPLVERYHGALIETAGDEALSSFPSAVDAVNCALAIQRELEGDSELRVRIGIHTGDVLFEGDRVHGDGVNVASRIRALAEPGGTYVSGEVYQSVRNQPNVEASALGERELKNIDRPVAIHAITGTPIAPVPHAARRPPARASRLLLAAGVAVAVVGIGLGWWALERANRPSDRIRSVAVLPLANLSGDPEQEYFTAGMTEALIGDLAKLESLRVVSRTSAMQLKEGTGVAEELKVDAVIEGSVLRAGPRVRITAKLIDAETDQNLWSESYEGDLSDILALQSEVAGAIAREIERELRPRGEVSFRRAVNPAAFEATLKGRHLFLSLTPADHKRSVKYFERAIREDPDYAPAYAGLADAYT